MTTRPVLGIICCNRTVGAEQAQAVMNRYVKTVIRHADVAALLIPALPDLMSAAEVVDRFDGILLTGSPSNVETHHYGDQGGDGPYDAERDRMMLDLVKATISRRLPLFGICRGFQEINVALGGTLRRDTSTSADLLSHHAADGVAFDDLFDHLHEVNIVPGGVLAHAYDRAQMTVNSVHYQGVARLAPPLSVEARAPDGLIEGYSGDVRGAPVLAVQWHPEWAADAHPDRQTFFHLLGRALRGEKLPGLAPISTEGARA